MNDRSSDKRSKREKLLAMLNDPGATEGERDNARRLLARLDGNRANPESPKRLTREDVKAQPNRSTPRGTVSWQGASGVWYHADADVSFSFTPSTNSTSAHLWYCSRCKQAYASYRELVAHDH